MKNNLLKGLIVVFTLIMMSFLVSAAPGVPHQFFGSVTANGEPIPDAFLVVAQINSVSFVTLTSNGGYGFSPDLFYIEDINNDKEGDTIEFFIKDKANVLQPATSVVFMNGLVQELNLVVTGDFSICGNGVVSGIEECDGSAPDHYICLPDCTLEYIPYCGDGIVNQLVEECDGDDGVVPGTICLHDCSLEITDSSAPIIYKTVHEPVSPMSDGDIELGAIFYPEMSGSFCDTENACLDVTLTTQIDISCEDEGQNPSGVQDICFSVGFDGDNATTRYCDGSAGVMKNGLCCMGEQPFSFHFLEESWHELTITCFDNLNTFSSHTEYFKVEGTAFEIQLNKKWNLISVPVKLQDDSMSELFDNQPGVESVWSYVGDSWKVYSPDGFDNDDLTTLVPGEGYYVLASEPSILTIGGSLLSPTVTPPVKEIVYGWNLIGYYGVQGAPVGENDIQGYYGPNLWGDGRVAWCALAAIRDSLWDMNAPSIWTYWELDNPNQWKALGETNFMNPGAGYWMFYSGQQGGVYAPSTMCDVLEEPFLVN